MKHNITSIYLSVFSLLEFSSHFPILLMETEQYMYLKKKK